MFKKAVTFAALLCLLTMPAFGAEEIEVSLTANKSKVGMDDTINIQVSVSGENAGDASEPKIEGIEEFETLAVSKGTEIVVVNMGMQRSNTYTYTLRPKSFGKKAGLKAEVTANDKIFSSNTVEVELVEKSAGNKQSGNQGKDPWSIFDQRGGDRFFRQTEKRNYRKDDFMLQARVNARQVYAGQEVIYTVAFYQAYGVYGEAKYHFPKAEGFWREDLPDNSRVKSSFETVAGRKYAVAKVVMLIYPLTDGKTAIGRSNIAFRLDAFAAPMEIESNNIILNVKPLPTSGKPDNFSGLIGNFDINAKTEGLSAEVGKPVKLNITISGRGNLQNIQKPTEPDLRLVERYDPEIKDNFKRTRRGSKGSRSFTYILIPMEEGSLEIGSFETNFFDPKTGKYSLIKTKPVLLEVKPSSGRYQVSGAATGSGKNGSGGIAGIKPDSQKIDQEGYPYYNNLFFWSYIIGLIVILIAASIWIQRKRRREELGLGNEHGAVAKRSKAHLDKAKSLLSIDKSDDFYFEIEKALLEFVTYILELGESEITLADIKNANGNEKIPDETLELLDKCQVVRFGSIKPDTATMGKILEEAERVIKKLKETV